MAGDEQERTPQVLGVVGFVLHAVTAVFPYAVTGLVAPLWGSVLAYVLWAALLLVGIGWWRGGHRNRVLLVPVLSIVGWLGLVALGGAAFDWRA